MVWKVHGQVKEFEKRRKNKMPEEAQEDLDHVTLGMKSLIGSAWAIRSTIHTTLPATPGQLVFGRDMLLNIPFKADWAAIQKRKQDLIGKGVIRANRSRVPHQYRVGDAVLYHMPGKIPKMQQPQTGPHTVTQVYSNGTIRIQRGSVEETINIRNVTPYFT
jgi:hypothetical protein